MGETLVVKPLKFNGQWRAAGGYRQVVSTSLWYPPIVDTEGGHPTHIHTLYTLHRLGSLHSLPFPLLPPGSWPHTGSTPSHRGPCFSIQQSENQEHQLTHIIIHLTAPWAWHPPTVLLFRLSGPLLPFSLHYSAWERAAWSGGVWLHTHVFVCMCVIQRGDCLDKQGSPQAILGKHQTWLVKGGKRVFDEIIIWPFKVHRAL